MTTNEECFGTNRSNPFHYQNFNLSLIAEIEMVSLLVELLSQTTFNQCFYFNTQEELDFLDKSGHGISLDH